MGSTLIVFQKNTELGKVKTRLAASIGDTKALQVYLNLIGYTKKIIDPLSIIKQIWYSSWIEIDDIWDSKSYDKRKQLEGDLGERISFSFKKAFQNSEVKKVIIIGTDCAEITEVARESGAEVPFTRNSQIADDYTDTRSVIIDGINLLEELGYIFNSVACIYPCIPLISVDQIKSINKMAEKNQDGYTLPITAFPYPTQRALCLNNSNKIKMIYPEHYSSRSQDLIETYHDAGCMYFASKQVWKTEKMIFSPNSSGYSLPRYMVQDIDTLDDWEHAELLYKLQENL